MNIKLDQLVKSRHSRFHGNDIKESFATFDESINFVQSRAIGSYVYELSAFKLPIEIQCVNVWKKEAPHAWNKRNYTGSGISSG